MGAHQASPSLGFSKQEHWSGLPFPSAMHESEKWKWSRSVVSDSSDPMDYSLPGSSIHGIFQAKVLEWGAIAFSARDSILCQTVSRLPVVNQVFLGSWAVDVHQEGHSQRSAPQKRHTAHPRRWAGFTPRKSSSRDGGGNKPQQLRSPSTWSPELLGPGKGTKCRPNWVCAFVEYPSTWTWTA